MLIFNYLRDLMKISIGAKIVDGPYGGGNAFLYNYIKYLKDQNHEVVNHLRDNDIDIIILINPLITSEVATFNHIDILYYINNVNSNAISIQRINDCDERKMTNYVNKQIIKSNSFVDVTVFVSDWLKQIYFNQGMKPKEPFVVRGGPDNKIFNNKNKEKWDKKKKLKIVTHHWSGNWMKGFDTYSLLDKLIEEKQWKNKIEFTYVGNLPKGYSFANTKVISPKSGQELSNELKKHNLYITGSLNEPSGNHHMEAALCGLPVLYIESGGIPEYCNDYGLSFDLDNIEEKLNEIINKYHIYFDNLKNYPYDFKYAANSLDDILNFVNSNRELLISRRKKSSKFCVNTYYLVNKIYRKLYYFFISFKKFFGKIKRLIS